MLDALRLARRELDGRVPLIGFAGAPWTLMSYMVEGEGSKAFTHAKRLLVQEPARAHALLARLAQAVGAFLVAQVRPARRRSSCSTPGRARWARATSASSRCPIWPRRCASRAAAGAPVIAFAPGAGWALEEIAAATGADVIGVDWQTDAADARRRLGDRPGGAAGQPGSVLALRAAGR